MIAALRHVVAVGIVGWLAGAGVMAAAFSRRTPKPWWYDTSAEIGELPEAGPEVDPRDRRSH